MSKLRGYVYAAIGIFGFSATFIGIALASDGFSPTIVAIGRIIPAGIGAIIALKLGGQPILPPRDTWSQIWMVALGLIFGFPIFSTLAMQTVPAAEAGVLVALGPVISAVIAISIFKHKKMAPMFWVAAGAGTIAAMLFAYSRANGIGGGELWGYGAMFIAMIFGQLGNVSAATMTARHKAFHVISWAIVISIPIMLPLTIVELVIHPITQMPSASAWVGFLWVSLYSIFIGHYFMANALNTIGIVKASQLQLLQPISTMVLAIIILKNHVSLITWLAAIAIVACVAWTQRINSARR